MKQWHAAPDPRIPPNKDFHPSRVLWQTLDGNAKWETVIKSSKPKEVKTIEGKFIKSNMKYLL